MATKITIPKSFISASIKAFCHPDPAADHKSFKCEISLETGPDKTMSIGYIPVLDRHSNIIIPVIAGENLVKITLLKSDVPVGFVVYSVSDFERFKGNCFAQWSNFQHNQDSKNQTPSDTRIIKVLFEFIVDTAGNIRAFQEQRNRFGEISEKQSEIEDNSVATLSHETSFANHESVSINEEKLEKNPTKGSASKHDTDAATDETSLSKSFHNTISDLETKDTNENNALDLPNPEFQDQKAPCPSLSLSLRKSEASVYSPIKKQILNSKCTSHKNSKGPSHVSSINTSHHDCVSASLETIVENIKETQSQHSIKPLAESKTNIPQDQTKKATQISQDKENMSFEKSDSNQLTALNQKLMESLKDSENSSFFIEFLGQMEKFSQEFKKIQSENDSLKTQVKRLETTIGDEKASHSNSRVSLLSTETKVSQLTHKSSEKTFDAKSNVFYELNQKVASLEKKLKQKEAEINLLREENKQLTSHGQLISNPLSQKKKQPAKATYTDDFVAKLKAENDKLKEALMHEQSNNSQKQQELLAQIQKNEAQEKKIKKLNEKMKELEETLKNATKAVANSEPKRQRTQRDSNNLSFISNTASQKAKEELYQLDCADDDETIDDIPGFSNFKKSYPQKSEPKCQREILQVNYSGDGMYDLGNKKVYIKKVNGSLFVRTGGGFVTFQDFITLQKEPEKTCAESLLNKGKARSMTPPGRSTMNRYKETQAILESGLSSVKKEKKGKKSLETSSFQKALSPNISSTKHSSIGKYASTGEHQQVNRSLTPTPNAVRAAKSLFK